MDILSRAGWLEAACRGHLINAEHLGVQPLWVSKGAWAPIDLWGHLLKSQGQSLCQSSAGGISTHQVLGVVCSPPPQPEVKARCSTMELSPPEFLG